MNVKIYSSTEGVVLYTMRYSKTHCQLRAKLLTETHCTKMFTVEKKNTINNYLTIITIPWTWSFIYIHQYLLCITRKVNHFMPFERTKSYFVPNTVKFIFNEVSQGTNKIRIIEEFFKKRSSLYESFTVQKHVN